eukprot:jgi/Orpsp1_1/1176870/evm.model.c7180000059338.1
MYVPEYKKNEDKENKNDYISQVYNNILVFHIISQINTGLIENVELTEPKEDIYSNAFFDKNNISNNSNINRIKITEENIKIYEIQPKFILMKKLKNDKLYFKKLKINDYTGKIDINDLLALKCNGKNIIPEATVKSVNFYVYMDRPAKWLALYLDCVSILRNILFLYTNIKNKSLIFDASLFVKEDMNFNFLAENLPCEYRYSNKVYYIDPPKRFLYKNRFFSCCIAYRIFLYRTILRLILKSNNSKNLISNIKTVINQDIIKENMEKKLDLFENNKPIFKKYQEECNNINNNEINCINDNNNNNKDDLKMNNNFNDNNNVKCENNQKDEKHNIFKKDNNLNNKNQEKKNQKKYKYWISYTNYMEMTIEEMKEFMSSCIYHQIVFILKNVISKCIDCSLCSFIFLSRITMKKLTISKIFYYYEFPSIIALYEIGTIYLAKYVANNGSDIYNDSIIDFSTNIDELKKRLKSGVSDNNWYIGKQYLSDTNKIKISNIINTENQSLVDKHNQQNQNL